MTAFDSRRHLVTGWGLFKWDRSWREIREKKERVKIRGNEAELVCLQFSAGFAILCTTNRLLPFLAHIIQHRLINMHSLNGISSSVFASVRWRKKAFSLLRKWLKYPGLIQAWSFEPLFPLWWWRSVLNLVWICNSSCHFFFKLFHSRNLFVFQGLFHLEIKRKWL